MCFYHDYDWCPDLVEETEMVSNGKVRCDECRRKVPVGEMCRHLYMQEHEDTDCQWCDGGKESDPGDPCTECGGDGYRGPGETFEWDCCMDCWKFLQAVEAAETEEGCKGDETRPSLTGMVEEIQELPRKDRRRYFVKALHMFPELKANGHLRRLAKMMF